MLGTAHIAIALGVALWCTPCGTVAQDARLTSDRFIKEAIQANLAEIQFGRLAREKGATRAVRQLGIRLVNDQQSANEDAVLAARHMDVAAPQTPNSRQVAAYGKLGRLSGESFDREFIQAELKDDERDIALYDYEAGHNSGPAASYAEETLYELEEHRKMAEDAEREEQPRRG